MHIRPYWIPNSSTQCAVLLAASESSTQTRTACTHTILSVCVRLRSAFGGAAFIRDTVTDRVAEDSELSGGLSAACTSSKIHIHESRFNLHAHNESVGMFIYELWSLHVSSQTASLSLFLFLFCPFFDDFSAYARLRRDSHHETAMWPPKV